MPLMLGGCQTANFENTVSTFLGGKPEASPGPGEASYSIFFGPDDHVSALLGEGRIAEASRVYVTEQEYFSRRTKNKETQKIVGSLQIAELEELRSAAAIEYKENDLTAPSNWSDIRNAIQSGTELISREKAYKVLGDNSEGAALKTKITSRIAGYRSYLSTVAHASLISHADLNFDFFRNYPIELDKHLVAKQVIALLGTTEVNLAPIAYLARETFNGLDRINQTALSGWLWRSACENLNKENLNFLLCKANDWGQVGLLANPQIAATVPFRVVSLIKDEAKISWQFLQPLVIDIKEARTSLKSLNHLVFVSSESGKKVDRREISNRRVNSRYVSGTRTLPNPEYLAQQQIVNAQQTTYAAAEQQSNISQYQSNNCYGASCTGAALGALGSIIGSIGARSRLKDEIGKLNQMSPTITEKIYQDYEYIETRYSLDRKIELKYSVFDRKKSRIEIYKTKHNNHTEVDIYSGVHKDDPSNYSLNSGKSEMGSFMEGPVEVNLGEMAPASVAIKKGDYTTALKIASVRIKNRATLRTASVSASINRYKGIMQSVVRIDTDEKNMGAGFYVSSDLVLTNHHVIEGSRFADITFVTGEKTFGKVVKTSPIKDLALIRVNKKGTPVIFHRGNFGIGDEVIAAGHPKGLSFSVTRGIVSATRAASIAGSGSVPVKLIQTDAAINKGNSGGPLFVDKMVIGINTIGYRKNISEGLGFAVHVDEIKNFLE